VGVVVSAEVLRTGFFVSFVFFVGESNSMIDIQTILKQLDVRKETATTANLPRKEAASQKEPPEGKVPGIRVGDSVTWHSPLFGRITGGPVLRVDENRYELIHPLTGEKVSLPLSWIGPPEKQATSSPGASSEKARMLP
jgi:hypothetical protein